ncbi:MAG: hypothetical protein AAF585_20315, partial [Verrucomicrobiota bacterium]
MPPAEDTPPTSPDAGAGMFVAPSVSDLPRLTTITAAGSSSGAAAAGQNIVGMTFAAGSSLR